MGSGTSTGSSATRTASPPTVSSSAADIDVQRLPFQDTQGDAGGVEVH